MKARQKELLTLIIKEHIKTAHPIGSTFLAEKNGIDVSSATLRNEMGTLEKEGYIYQLHTSSGRVPTEKGYRFFLEHIIPKKLGKTEVSVLERASRESAVSEDNIKLTAKAAAEISQEMIIIAFGPRDTFYTGVSYLFSKPEFIEAGQIQSLSRLLDHLDERMKNIYDSITSLTVLLGEDNPFGNDCATVLAPFGKKNNKGVVGLLGPLRMQYEKNMSLIDYLGNSL